MSSNGPPKKNSYPDESYQQTTGSEILIVEYESRCRVVDADNLCNGWISYSDSPIDLEEVR